MFLTLPFAEYHSKGSWKASKTLINYGRELVGRIAVGNKKGVTPVA
jgi:hypothetical protein